MISKYGTRAVLRRADGDRDCIACEIDFITSSSPGSLRSMPHRVYLVSANNLNPPPDAEKDHLVWMPGTPEEETLRIAAPVGKFAPAGVTVYYELQPRA